MKKKRILLGCFVATMSLVLTACDFLPTNLFPNKNSSSQESSQRSRISRDRSSSEGPHVHEFSKEWSYNATSHWHDATCGHNLKSEIGSHDYYSAVIKEPTCIVQGEQVNICKICDYRTTVSIPTTDHNWFEYSRVEPTCYESGLSKRYCTNCGTSTEEYLPPLDHDYEAISYQAPTCSVPGHAIMACRRCGAMTEYDIPTTSHNWGGSTTYIGSQDGFVGYSMNTCRVCGTTRILIRALDGMLNGSFKSGSAYDFGYMKLANNGQSISYTFNYPNAAYGRLYQHACYDNYSYYGYTYRYGARNDAPYNFEANLNGAVVDMSQSGDIPYEQFLDNGEEDPYLMNYGYSRVNNCLIGDVTLSQGTNTLTYTRTGSYNLWIDYFVFEIFNSDHVHSVSPEWYADDISHWHACTDPNCPVPNSRIDGASHSFSEVITVVEATCHGDGIQRQICSVCQYCKDTVIPATDHNYVNIGAFEKVEDCVNLDEYGCQYCDQYVLRWNALEYNEGLSNDVELYNSNAVRFKSGRVENQNGVDQRGAHIVYKLYSPVALSNVGLAFNITQSTGYPIFDITSSSGAGYVWDNNGNLVQATKKYGLIVNDNEIQLGEDVYGTSPNISTSTPRWFNWPVTLNLVAGVNTIDIYCLMSSYRARIYEFQLTGIPYIQPNHTHVSDGILHCDDNSHFNLCVGGDGTKLNEEPHTFTDYETVTEASCTESGQKVRTCTVCGYQQYTSIKSTGHSYGEHYVSVEPTCTEYGVEEAVCSICGEVGTWSISPLGHTWDEGVVIKEPTHNESGEKLYTCTVCHEQMTKAIKPDHSWGSPTYIDASDGCVGYTKQRCLDDNAYKLDIKALDGTFAEGSYNYSGAPEGYLRLNSAGHSISYRFSYNDHAFGKLYLRSTVGNFSRYNTRSYSYNGTGQNGCTFEFYVNGNLVDMSETKDKTFQELLGDGWIDPNLPSDYSPIDDCLIGTVELFNGVNTIEYLRTGSFTLNSSDLILVVEHSDHEHTYSNSYSMDENYHWRTCSDPTCPSNGSTPKEPHDFVEVEKSSQNSCNDQINHTYVCSVCGYQKSYKDSIEHTFDDSQTYYGTNSEGKSFTVKYCPTCNKTVEAMPFADGTFFNGSYTSGKLAAGTTVQWLLPVYQTGVISIYLPCKMSSGNTGQTYNPSLYVINVNGVNLENLMPSGTYDELGIGSSETKYFKWAEYEVTQADLQNGEILLQFTSNNSNYRMIFDGEIRIEY